MLTYKLYVNILASVSVPNFRLSQPAGDQVTVKIMSMSLDFLHEMSDWHRQIRIRPIRISHHRVDPGFLYPSELPIERAAFCKGAYFKWKSAPPVPKDSPPMPERPSRVGILPDLGPLYKSLAIISNRYAATSFASVEMLARLEARCNIFCKSSGL